MILVSSTHSSYTCNESWILTKPPAGISWSRNQSEPLLSIGLLTTSGWRVELCPEGSISLLHSLCSNVSVCANSLLQHSRFPSEIKSVIAGANWYATKWSRTLWLLSKSSALSSCSPPPVCLKGNPICSDVSHNHVDSSAKSALKAIASLPLHCHNSVATLLVVYCQHTSDLQWWISCRSVAAVVFVSSFESLLCALSTCHLDPVASCDVKFLVKLLDDPALCTLLALRFGFCHHPALSNRLMQSNWTR